MKFQDVLEYVNTSALVYRDAWAKGTYLSSGTERSPYELVRQPGTVGITEQDLKSDDWIVGIHRPESLNTENQKRERRERIATACLAGLLADPEFTSDREVGARAALAYADALIKELDKED